MQTVLENNETLEAALDAAHGDLLSGLWTAMPAIVQSFNANKQTITAQLAIQGIVTGQDGKQSAVDYPLLLDVPIIVPRAGGFTVTVPIKAGDECLIVFASRCIDTWWQSGGYKNIPAWSRTHDLSDGFAIMGTFSQATKISGYSTNSVQVRTDDGSTFAEVGHGVINLNAATVNINTQSFNVNAPQSNFNGSQTTTGNITANGDVNSGGIGFNNHTHSGVQSGNNSTGKPQ